MMKKSRKLLALSMSILIIGIGLLGCADGNQNAEAQTGQALEKTEKEASEAEKEEDKPEKITVICTTDDAGYFGYMGEVFKEKYGVDVEIISQAYNDTKTKITTSVTSGNADVIYLDTVWPAEFADMGMILPIDDYISPKMKDDILEGALNQMYVNGSLYGVPYCNNGMFMYYNKKMLKDAGYDAPPETWTELKEMSQTMQEKGICKYGIAWPGLQAEGSICNMTTMLYSFGGEWVDDLGNFTFNSDKGVQAVEFMTKSIADGWADPSSVAYSDRDILDAFLAGDTAFVTNWSYALGVANDPSQSQVSGQVDVCLVPGENGVRSAFVTGGGGLGILSTSKHPDYAWKYIELLGEHDIQAYGCEQYGVMPTSKSVFEDPKLQEKFDYLRLMYPQFTYPASRPAVPNYSEWSNIVQVSLSSVMVGDTDAETGLNQAYEQVKDFLK